MARFREKNDRHLRETYIMNTLRMVSESTANAARGPYMPKRFDELLTKPDNRTGEEIAADIVQKAGLKVRKKGGE